MEVSSRKMQCEFIGKLRNYLLRLDKGIAFASEKKKIVFADSKFTILDLEMFCM